MDATRVDAELALLRTIFPNLECAVVDDVHWVRIPKYPLPAGWSFAGEKCTHAELAFRIPTQAGQAPYGFVVRPAIVLSSGATPGAYSASVTTPWGTDFAQFSWSPAEAWIPKTDITAGSNMLDFARSFIDRLSENS